MRTATFLFVLALAAAGACRTQPPSTQAPGPAMAANPLYVDVRTPEEFASGHVVGALNIPHDQMAARWQELASYKDKDVVLYCRSGRRSGLALDVLKEKGFTKAQNGGGLEDLQKRGVATRK